MFAVRRSTLCLAKDSVLAALFSGSWDAGQHRDSKGRPFLDIDPYIFDKIVNFLRQKSIEGPESPAPTPVISSEKAKEFERVVEYYGLKACLYGPRRDERKLRFAQSRSAAMRSVGPGPGGFLAYLPGLWDLLAWQQNMVRQF